MANSFILEQFKRKLKGKAHFNREELFHFYQQHEPDLKETTFRWRLHDLKAKKLITALSRNSFSFTYKPIFEPLLNTGEQRLYGRIEKNFHGLRLCLWSTQMLTEFMLHLTNRTMTILEVEKDALEPVYHFLKDKEHRDVFLQPNRIETHKYVNDAKAPLIVLPLITKAPLQKTKKKTTTTLEKIIVDLFCEKDLFEAFQGSELTHIINTANSKYAIDLTRLMNYAERRRKQDALKKYLSDRTDILTSLNHD